MPSVVLRITSRGVNIRPALVLSESPRSWSSPAPPINVSAPLLPTNIFALESPVSVSSFDEPTTFWKLVALPRSVDKSNVIAS